MPKATTGCANQKPGRAARLICLVKDINFIDVNRLDSSKQSHLSYAMLYTVFISIYISPYINSIFRNSIPFSPVFILSL